MAEKTYKRPTKYEVENLRRLNEAQSNALAQTRARVAQLEAAARAYFREFDHLIGETDYPERVALRNALNMKTKGTR